jgi:hypothetical protein
MRLQMPRRIGGVLAVAAAYSAVAVAPVGNQTLDVARTAACAIALAVCLIAVADQIAASRSAQFAVWFTLIFLNLVAVAVEGTLFVPAAAPPSALGANLVRLAITAAAVAAIIAGLFSSRESPAPTCSSGQRGPDGLPVPRSGGPLALADVRGRSQNSLGARNLEPPGDTNK